MRRSGIPLRGALGALFALLLAPPLTLTFTLTFAAAPSLAASAWLDDARRPTPDAQAALQALADAGSDGLDPADYGAQALAARARALGEAAGGADAAQAAAFERDLQQALLRLLRHLSRGRVEPASLGFRVARPAPPTPAEDLARLQRALAQHELPRLVEEARPRLRQYARLREALRRYRELVAAPPVLPPFPGLPARSLRPGEPFDGAAVLREWLVRLGDLPADAAAAGSRYDEALAQGVQRFQARHGLAVDGIVGRATAAAMAVPMSRRVAQIEWALERLRWLPALGEQPLLAVNIPMFRLWAWDPAAPQLPPLTMGVVVGKALDTRTPVLAADMRHLIFRPYWNVPPSILRNESLPAIARDPGWLARNDMEIVRGAGDDARPAGSGADAIAGLREGSLRLRQRPGPRNALGLVKFIFPNHDNVYLHGTPATALFAQPRRDHSHGCVRVEHPVELAQWVLRDHPDWNRVRIEAAMAGPAVSQQLNLARPLPVLLFYLTAMVWPDDGRLHFAEDLYGHDARLAQALALQQRRG